MTNSSLLFFYTATMITYKYVFLFPHKISLFLCKRPTTFSTYFCANPLSLLVFSVKRKMCRNIKSVNRENITLSASFMVRHAQ